MGAGYNFNKSPGTIKQDRQVRVNRPEYISTKLQKYSITPFYGCDNMDGY